jgi:hypothetical protein
MTATSVVAGHDVDAGDRHQAANIVVAEDLLSDDGIDLCELPAEEVQLAQAAVDGQALIEREDLLGDPRAALDADGSLAGLRPLRLRCSTERARPPSAIATCDRSRDARPARSTCSPLTSRRGGQLHQRAQGP